MPSHTTKQRIQRLLKNNKVAKALSASNELCRIAPTDPEAWLISASIHAQLGNLIRVIECCEKTITLAPKHLIAHYNLAIAHQSTGNLSAAEEALNATLKLNPKLHTAKIALGYVLLQLGQTDRAITVYKNALKEPSLDDTRIRLKAYTNLSLALLTQKRFSEAEMACKNALKIDSNSAHALNNLGQALKEQGKLNQAINAYQKAVKTNPDFIVAHSNYLLDLNFLTGTDNNTLFAEHRQWARQHATAFTRKQHSNTACDPDKRLRVGYVSPDFRAHSVILFIAGLIEAHNRNNVEIFCYSDVESSDAYTEQIRTTADHWREINTVSDEQLDQIIEQDKIDILVDLAGHTANNRLLVFARKPAPIQLTWLGYPNTTGLTSMDYRLTDAWADPPGSSDELHTETLIRLPHGFLCYRPLHDSPPVSDLPWLDNGYVTFGSFNSNAKINADVIKLWGKVLLELPRSRLILKSMQLSDPTVKRRYLTAFNQAGIDSVRIDLHGCISSTVEHLALYQKIDIALDPFPYNGTTTTCEALWMGVPVVALEGDNHASRVSASLLAQTGLTQLLANTDESYIRICTELASNPEALSRLRAGMRKRLRKTPLLNTQGFAEDVETAYRAMWHSFCAQ